MAQDYVSPKYNLTAFHCPHCGAFAHQIWRTSIVAIEKYDGSGEYSRLQDIHASICKRCNNFSLSGKVINYSILQCI